MAIAAHEGIGTLRPNEQPQAIPAVMQLVNSQLQSIGIDPHANTPVQLAAVDGMMRTMTPQHIRAATAIGSIAGLSYVTPQFVNRVMQSHRLSGQGEQTQAYERVVLEAMGRAQQPFQGRA